MDVRCPKCEARHFPQPGPLSDGVYRASCLECNTTFRFSSTVTPASTVCFSINGKQYTVGSEAMNMKLSTFIRDTAGLTGTKTMCQEGGCGACVIAATFTEPTTKRQKTAAVNSCLCPVLSCDGWAISTVEGLGNGQSGYHPIQQMFADKNASQCGYCTSGMVMNTFSLLSNGDYPCPQQVEDAFDGNICRCTGYRAILEAAHALAKQDTPDIEDLTKSLCLGAGGEKCNKNGKQGGEPLYICSTQPNEISSAQSTASTTLWLRPVSLDELYGILKQHSTEKIRMVVGNTSTGVFKKDGPYDVYVDTKGITDFYNCKISKSQLDIGANVSLSILIDILEHGKDLPGFSYFGDIVQHLKVVASTPVRNVASWVGNLMVKHAHPEFPSDLFVMFEAAGVSITVGSSSGTQTVSPSQLLDLDMAQKVIIKMSLNALYAPEGSEVNYRSFKITPRAQNNHAYVNAAMVVIVDGTFNITAPPRLVFGGISKSTIHATKTEQFLVGKNLLGSGVLAGVMSTLSQELNPAASAPGPSAEYRRTVAVALLYKVLLGIVGDRASPAVQSGALNLQRPLSTGTETFFTDKAKWPLTQPVAKRKAIMQTSGEVQYINDMGPLKGELYAAFVLASQGNADIDGIDASKAMTVPGVVKFLSAQDIAASGGQNNFMPRIQAAEEVFCSKHVLYAGQAVGIIVADSRDIAESAAQLVQINYSNVQPPILTIQDAIKAGSLFPNPSDPVVQGDAETAIAGSKHQLSGQVNMEAQYHFHMETQSCICVPNEGGMDCYPSTQWPDYDQTAAANVCNIPSSRVSVSVKRLGGAYGGKITRTAWVTAACAFASHVTQRPVNLQMSMSDNMQMIGKRCPYMGEYKVGFDDEGKLNGVEITFYGDAGCCANDQTVTGATFFGDNAYYCENWRLVPKLVKTNTPSTTYCRSPSSVPAIFIMESIMEQVARSLGADPAAVRALNLYQAGQVTPYKQPLPYCSIGDLWKELMASAQVQQRKDSVRAFNKGNRWKKRGMSVVPMKFGLAWSGVLYNCLLDVYNNDGSVAITHGGIEMGQGIDTKVIHVVAYELGIPMEQVSVLPTDTTANANSSSTGGSVTSELCCLAAIECCKQIKTRLAPVKEKFPTANWQTLITKAYAQGIDLSARYWTQETPPSAGPFQYNSYGVTCCEVELDVLTGETSVTRADVLYDCGESINPLIDMGQCQGAFVMGLGYYLLERLQYDPQTGRNLTDTTWDYHPPTSKDIPVDLRVTLRKEAPNPLGVLGAKACAEPPLTMSCAVLFAVQDAISSARRDAGNAQPFVQDAPCTIDVALKNCLTDVTQMTF